MGAYLLLDVSQCAGAMKIDVAALGADFLACAGYKWLLSPYGTGFFWIRRDLIEKMRPAPANWTALEGADNFSSLAVEELKFSSGSRRWDSPETASFTNLAAMEASLEYLLRVGVETVWNHNENLIRGMIERLPRDRCVLVTPEDAKHRGTVYLRVNPAGRRSRCPAQKVDGIAGVCELARRSVADFAAPLQHGKRYGAADFDFVGVEEAGELFESAWILIFVCDGNGKEIPRRPDETGIGALSE